MPSLPELTRELVEGTRRQKQRSWQALVVDAGLWPGCRSVLPELDELARAYGYLTGPWDRPALAEVIPNGLVPVEVQLRIVERTIAAAALAAVARRSHDPQMLMLWAARASGDTLPLPAWEAGALPPGSARCRVRTAFRTFHADPARQGGALEARRALAAAQEAALTFLAGLPGEEPLPRNDSVKVPLLFARGETGFLAWLWLERRRRGFGQVFQAPDSLLSPLLPDLREAIEAACRVGRAGLDTDDDVLWAISDLPECPDGQRIPVGGASAGAAAAVGTSHLLRGQKIRADCVITATLTPEGCLGAVDGLRGAAPKLDAARRLGEGGAPVTVIVSPDSRPSEVEVAAWQDQGVEVVTACTVGDAERLSTAPAERHTESPLVLLSVRDSPRDRAIGEALARSLAPHGFRLEMEAGEGGGVAWAQEADRRIRSAERVLVLVTPDSEASETWGLEVQLAHEACQAEGRPQLLVLAIEPALPPEILTGHGYPCVALAPAEGAADPEEAICAPTVLGLVYGSRRRTGLPDSDPFVSPTGALPPDSPFYLERLADRDFRAALVRGDSIIRIKGARQMGKTSLMARGLQQARATGATVIFTDFQLLNQRHLESVDVFFQMLARHLAHQVAVKLDVEGMWDSWLGASVNFREFLLELLPQVPGPIVWGLDEVDRLFTCDFHAEVFGLLRSLHNERAINPALPWSRLSLILCYATEAQLFLSDLNQSPFNVGTRIPLDDFSRDEVAELNQRYELPLRSMAERAIYYDLLAGHPYLTHRGLHALATGGLTLTELQRRAVREDGIFGDHLRRLLLLLARDPELSHAVGEIVRGRPCPSTESFYRLWSGGVVVGESARDARPRCRLYADYLGRHLP